MVGMQAVYQEPGMAAWAEAAHLEAAAVAPGLRRVEYLWQAGLLMGLGVEVVELAVSPRTTHRLALSGGLAPPGWLFLSGDKHELCACEYRNRVG